MYFIVIRNLIQKFAYRDNGSSLVSNILRIGFRDEAFWSREEDLLVEKL